MNSKKKGGYLNWVDMTIKILPESVMLLAYWLTNR